MATKKRKPSARKRIGAALKKYVRSQRRANPSRSVRVKNFTGVITRTADGQVNITGVGAKKNPARKRAARKR